MNSITDERPGYAGCTSSTCEHCTPDFADYDHVLAPVRQLSDDDLVVIVGGLQWLATAPKVSHAAATTLRELAQHAQEIASKRRYFRGE